MDRDAYEAIEPLIAETREEGEVLHCTFRCPVSGETVAAQGKLEKGRGLGEVSTRSQSLLDSLRRGLGALLRGTLRPEPAEPEGANESAFTEDERRAATYQAFHGLPGAFVWDPQRERWVSAGAAGDLLSDFARQLGIAPVSERDDRDALARMLVEVARADGQVTPTEWRFMAEFIPFDLGSVDTYMERPALTAQELQGTTRGAVRDTMLMLAWALALTDEDQDAAETEQMAGYARGLRIPADRAEDLRGYARGFLLEQAFAAGKPADAQALGARLGLDPAQVAAAEEAYRRRGGT